MKVIINGKTVKLDKPQFSGGEKDIYVSGGFAHCIFKNPQNVMPDAKFRELNKLDSPVILRPLYPIFDEKGRNRGFTTHFVKNTYTLAETFTKAFKLDHNYSQEDVLKNIRRLFEIVSFVHSKNCLIVDLNELNILVSQDLRSLYSIDVNSYQTPSYAATAIMESIRDWHNEFSPKTDWFSAAVLSFYMFHGIHPYRGRHPQFTGDLGEVLKRRMQANCSVYEPQTKIPPVVYSLDSAPTTLRGWWQNTFRGGRELPPSEFNTIIVVKPKKVVGTGLFSVKHISSHKKVFDVMGRTVLEERGKLLNLWGKPTRVSLNNYKVEIEGYDCNLTADAFCVVDSRLIIKMGTNLVEAQIRPNINGVGSKKVGSISAYDGRLFDGVALQRAMGRIHATLFTPTLNTQLPIPELDSYKKILGAKFSKGVLIVTGMRQGRYWRSTFIFSDRWKYSYEKRELNGNWGINFVVNDKKVCVLLNEDGCVEAFQVRSNPQPKIFDFDPAIYGTLFCDGADIMLGRDNELVRIGMTQ